MPSLASCKKWLFLTHNAASPFILKENERYNTDSWKGTLDIEKEYCKIKI